MRKAICHYSLHRRFLAEKWTLDRFAQEVQALGVEGIDFHSRFLGDPARAPELIRAALSRHGLVLSGLSLSNNFNKENLAEVRDEMQKVKTWLRVASAVGAPVSRIFGGQLSPEQRADPAILRQAMQRIQDSLAEVVREAERLNVVLAIENHGGLPCTGEEQAAVIRAINSPNLKATIDVGNYLSGNQEAEAGTRLAAPYAAYVHLKDYKKVPKPKAPYGRELHACVVGEGDVDQGACLKILRDAGYTGFVALEYEGVEDETTGVPKSVKFMNSVMAGY